MIAAIYARVSVEKDGVAEDDKSPARQVENARAFALAHGWTVHPTHVYKDTASGAEFQRRPGYQRMLSAALVPKPPFQILIVSEQKTLGREAFETNFTIKQLAVAGIEIYEYMHGRCLTPRNAMDKVVGAIQGFGDESHREMTSERVHEAFIRKVKTGGVVGGRVFGYTNHRISPSQVERRIDPIEAAVVLKIFQYYDSGLGLKKIAKTLQSEGAASPKPFIRADPTKVGPVVGWSPSTVGAILARTMYHGVIEWNKSRKSRVAWGGVKQTPRPESDWIRTTDEKLRIVPEDLWSRVASRRKDLEGRTVRFDGGRLLGRPPKKATSNLLSGLATCSMCGGGLIVETSARKRGRVPEYVCSRRRLNGSCENKLRINVADVNEAVLAAVEAHALTPDAIEQVIHLSERDDVSDLQAKLERERKDIEKRLKHLTNAIETGGDAATLSARVRELEARRAAIDVESTHLMPIPRLAPEVIANRLAEWRRILRASTTQGRTVLQRVLVGRLVFTPHVNPISGEPDGYTFAGETRYDRLFSGLAVETPKWVKAYTGPTGAEGIRPSDTYDADYGEMLDRAAKKCALGDTSPTGFEPVFWP